MPYDWLTRISIDNLRPLSSWFSDDLAIDLVRLKHECMPMVEASWSTSLAAVVLDERTNEVQAFGQEAKQMLGRTAANIRVVKPLKDGVIADFRVTERMLAYFIQKAHQRRTLVHPRIVISIPSEITQVERRAV